MNTTQCLVFEVLRGGPQQASGILDALAKRGWKEPIEELYTELVAMEGAELVRVEPFRVDGQQAGCLWALGRRIPKFEPEKTSVADLLHLFGRPTLLDDSKPTPTGVIVHRCL